MLDLMRQEYIARKEYIVKVLEKINTRDDMFTKKIKEACDLAQEILVESKKK
jgi:hypothetical protein